MSSEQRLQPAQVSASQSTARTGSEWEHGADASLVRFHRDDDDEDEPALRSARGNGTAQRHAGSDMQLQAHHPQSNGVQKRHAMKNHDSGSQALHRGRSYSKPEDEAADEEAAGAFQPSMCFEKEFLEEPLLQDRGSSSETAQHLFGTPPPRLNLEWKDISLQVAMPTAQDPKAQLKILRNVSGRAYCGEMIAVMGPSGSGKTTLISLLAGGWRRPKAAGDLTGSVLVNEKEATKRMSRFIAMISQDDLLFSNLTVEQTLKYAALLNLPKELTREEKLDRVEKVISVLGLHKCRTTKIGGGMERGVSGGERKRCSVANELLMNPSVILADEPTSGLDR